MYNYIYRFTTPNSIYSTYHDNTIIFTTSELSKYIDTELFYELKTKSRCPDMFAGLYNISPKLLTYKSKFNPSTNTQSRISTLPSYINPDNFIEEFRSTLASSILFIYTWLMENKHKNKDISNNYDNFMNDKFHSYKQCFTKMFTLIIKNESDLSVISIANTLSDSMRHIINYFGPFKGISHFMIYKTQCVLMLIIMSVYIRSFGTIDI